MYYLLHGSTEWILGMFIAFFGIMFLGVKVALGRWNDLFISVAVWFFVYSMHSGSNAGIMTATGAALLFDMFGMPILRGVKKVNGWFK